MKIREFIDNRLTLAQKEQSETDALCDVDKAHWITGEYLEAMIDFWIDKSSHPWAHKADVKTIEAALRLLNDAI